MRRAPIALLPLLLLACSDDSSPPLDAATADAPVIDAPAAIDAAPVDVLPGADADLLTTPTERVRMETSMGDMVIELYGNGAPITVANFLVYVDEGAFTDTIFHRVIPDFMVQGGGLYADMSSAAAHDPIVLEILPGLSHQPGVISMARTSVPNSATRQFFICVADDSFLDGNYAAFGKVVEGYDVAVAMSLVTTGSVDSYDDVPVTPIVITSATRIGLP
jgi:peptidyl-prolyl cis-trans isomerase A (cyclophilin A)